MGKSVTLGGDRLGSGKKQKVNLHGFERSSHDLGHVVRTTMASGTLVPFLNLLALPGDTFDIKLGADVKTHPTLGPLFASFKLQLDVFLCPIRLYHSWLHNNRLKIGLDMAKVKLPLMEFDCNVLDFSPSRIPLEFQQINQSSLLAYLGYRGAGNPKNSEGLIVNKQAVPVLAYWDIYKNYYANKSEEIGVVVHTENLQRKDFSVVLRDNTAGTDIYSGNGAAMNVTISAPNTYKTTVTVDKSIVNSSVLKTYLNYVVNNGYGLESKTIEGNSNTKTDGGASWIYTTNTFTVLDYGAKLVGIEIVTNQNLAAVQKQIQLKTFPLDNIDQMRSDILTHDNAYEFVIDQYGLEPYNLPLKKLVASGAYGQMCAYASQEGLGIKTYQSDIYNNWISSEWIDGENGINAITSIDTSGGSFDLDTLNLAKKVYDMLNRIAVSGGTYDDWLEAVYDHQSYRKAETPMYMGGLSKEIIFQEVVATTASGTEQSLGELGGRGSMAGKHKGGSVTVKVDEPSFIMGIVSITPRIDYYQGNDWTTNLKTMDDLHKPNLDEIGFQDLITDQMAYWDTTYNEGLPTYTSAGKQPAWLNYMTAVNRLYGNFADERNEMYMTLARRYESEFTEGYQGIKDLTTYIDPTKFNYAFAQTSLDAQNFWVQIGMDITARRKISARLMPNL